MVVMVNKVGYDEIGEEMLEMQKEEVGREDYPTTYDI